MINQKFRGYVLEVKSSQCIWVYIDQEPSMGIVILNFEFDHLFEVGDYLEFETTGIMTLSIPPLLQVITYEIIEEKKQHIMKGILKNVAPPLVLETENWGVVWVHHEGSLDLLGLDRSVYIIYNGMMTRSLPPQISAIKIVGLEYL